METLEVIEVEGPTVKRREKTGDRGVSGSCKNVPKKHWSRKEFSDR